MAGEEELKANDSDLWQRIAQENAAKSDFWKRVALENAAKTICWKSKCRQLQEKLSTAEKLGKKPSLNAKEKDLLRKLLSNSTDWPKNPKPEGAGQGSADLKPVK